MFKETVTTRSQKIMSFTWKYRGMLFFFWRVFQPLEFSNGSQVTRVIARYYKRKKRRVKREEEKTIWPFYNKAYLERIKVTFAATSYLSKVIRIPPN